MTSGNFATIDIDKIVILRDERQRKVLRGVEELAESINRLGLIHPPVVNDDLILIAGERRIAAMKMLGWTHTSIQYSRDLDPLYLHTLELEENVKRLDITWQERCDAILKYEELRSAAEPVTQAQLAKELGFSNADLSRNLSVAKALRAGNERVRSADKFTTAVNIVERVNARAADTARDNIGKAVVEIATLPDEEIVVPTKVVPLLNEDFHEWAAAYCDRPFNFIHCDFPYGVGMHKSDQGAGQEFGTYEDGEDVYWKLLDTLEMSMSNVVAESSHLLFWFSMDYYQRTFDRLQAMGWRVNAFPLIWLKSDNTGIIPDANRGPRRIYETAFFASRGDRKIVRAKANAFSWPGKDKSIHMNEKPVPMLRHFMEMFIDEYSFVLDPTAGSANALKAAQQLGASAVLGLERDREFYDRSVEAYFATELD